MPSRMSACCSYTKVVFIIIIDEVVFNDMLKKFMALPYDDCLSKTRAISFVKKFHHTRKVIATRKKVVGFVDIPDKILFSSNNRNFIQSKKINK